MTNSFIDISAPISLLQICPLNHKDLDFLYDLYELILKKCMEIFGNAELVFDVVSDSDLYDMNSYSDGLAITSTEDIIDSLSFLLSINEERNIVLNQHGEI